MIRLLTSTTVFILSSANLLAQSSEPKKEWAKCSKASCKLLVGETCSYGTVQEGTVKISPPTTSGTPMPFEIRKPRYYYRCIKDNLGCRMQFNSKYKYKVIADYTAPEWAVKHLKMPRQVTHWKIETDSSGWENCSRTACQEMKDKDGKTICPKACKEIKMSEDKIIPPTKAYENKCEQDKSIYRYHFRPTDVSVSGGSGNSKEYELQVMGGNVEHENNDMASIEYTYFAADVDNTKLNSGTYVHEYKNVDEEKSTGKLAMRLDLVHINNSYDSTTILGVGGGDPLNLVNVQAGSGTTFNVGKTSNVHEFIKACLARDLIKVMDVKFNNIVNGEPSIVLNGLSPTLNSFERKIFGGVYRDSAFKTSIEKLASRVVLTDSLITDAKNSKSKKVWLGPIKKYFDYDNVWKGNKFQQQCECTKVRNMFGFVGGPVQVTARPSITCQRASWNVKTGASEKKHIRLRRHRIDYVTATLAARKAKNDSIEGVHFDVIIRLGFDDNRFKNGPFDFRIPASSMSRYEIFEKLLKGKYSKSDWLRLIRYRSSATKVIKHYRYQYNSGSVGGTAHRTNEITGKSFMKLRFCR